MLINVLNAFFALTIIAASIGLLAQGAKWLGLTNAEPKTMKRHGRRLAILDAAPLDARRRLFLVRIDDEERALLIGGENDLELSPLVGRAEISRARAKTRDEDDASNVVDLDAGRLFANG